MKDLLGNKLEAGQLVLWNQLVAKVKAVHEGLTIVKKGDVPEEPTYIVLEVKVATQKHQPVPVIRVVDPASDALLDSLEARA